MYIHKRSHFQPRACVVRCIGVGQFALHLWIRVNMLPENKCDVFKIGDDTLSMQQLLKLYVEGDVPIQDALHISFCKQSVHPKLGAY